MTFIALRLGTVQLLSVKLTILHIMLLHDHTSILKNFVFHYKIAVSGTFNLQLPIKNILAILCTVLIF